jgi:DUF1126 PH-like domain
MVQQRFGRKTPSSTSDDKLRRFIEYSGMVLSFDSVLDETDRPGGELITFKLYFYLEDDTVAIKELPENQQGRDGFSLLLKRTKLPKNWQKKPIDLPAVVFNVSDAEVEEYYGPKDFMIGGTIFVFGRKFLLLDCDRFTRRYFDQVLRCPQPNKLEIEKPTYPEIKIVSFKYFHLSVCKQFLRNFTETARLYRSWNARGFTFVMLLSRSKTTEERRHYVSNECQQVSALWMHDGFSSSRRKGSEVYLVVQFVGWVY